MKSVDVDTQKRARVIAANSWLVQAQPDKAWHVIDPLLSNPPLDSSPLTESLIQISISTGWEWEWCESQLLEKLKARPEDRLARDRLAYLYGQSTRWISAREQVLTLISLGESSVARQLLLALEERMPPDLHWLERSVPFEKARCGEVSAGVQLARLNVAWRMSQPEKCLEILQELRSIARVWPDQADLESRIECDLGNPLPEDKVAELARRAESDSSSVTDAGVNRTETQLDELTRSSLLSIARELVQRGRGKAVIGILPRLYDHDPGRREVCFLLGQALGQSGKTELSESFLTRARQLEAYKNEVYAAFTAAANQPLSESQLAKLAHSAHRLQLERVDESPLFPDDRPFWFDKRSCPRNLVAPLWRTGFLKGKGSWRAPSWNLIVAVIGSTRVLHRDPVVT
mgnify:CR=1 FL=1